VTVLYFRFPNSIDTGGSGSVLISTSGYDVLVDDEFLLSAAPVDTLIASFGELLITPSPDVTLTALQIPHDSIDTGVLTPQTLAEWALLPGFGVPGAIHTFQGASGAVPDVSGNGIAFTANGADWHYLTTPPSAWGGRGMEANDFAGGGSGTNLDSLSCALSGVPDLSTTSCAVLLYTFSAANSNAVKNLLELGAAGALTVSVDGSATAGVFTGRPTLSLNGVSFTGFDPDTGSTPVLWWLLQYDVTHSVVHLYTNYSRLTVPFAAIASGQLIRILSSQAAGSPLVYLLFDTWWFGAAAEFTEANAQIGLRNLGLPLWTNDLRSGIKTPLTAADFAILSLPGVGAPSFSWPCQEISGNLLDIIGGITLTAANSPTYANLPFHGSVTWNRYFLQLAANTSENFSSSSASLPDLRSESFTIYGIFETRSATGTKIVLQIGAASGGVQIQSLSTGSIALVCGSNSVSSTHDYGTQTNLGAFLLRFDVTHSTCTLFLTSLDGIANAEQLTVTYTAFSGGSAAQYLGLGDSVGATSAKVGFGGLVAWRGAAAEISNATAWSLLGGLKWPAWPVLYAGSGTFIETGTPATLARGYVLLAGSGTFVETGTPATLIYSGATNVTLNAGSGSFVETGTPATLAHGYVLLAGSGSFIETGTPATLTHDVPLHAGSGSFVETGTPATLEYGRVVVAGSGTFVETGTSATLEHDRVLEAGSGTFIETGTPATLARGYVLVAGSGTFVETGTAAALEVGRVVDAGSGSFVETGTAATLLHDYVLVAGSGSFVETGTPADLIYSGATGITLFAGSGTFVETGTAAGLEVGHVLVAGSGTFVETGTSATLQRDVPLHAGSGTFIETGTPATLARGYVLVAGSGSFVETGTPAALNVGYTLNGASGTFTETGTPADLIFDHVLVTGSGTFVETGTPATLVHDVPLHAGSGTFLETGTPATLLHHYVLEAGSGSFVETGTPATLVAGRRLAAGSGSFIETGTPATLTHDYKVLGGSGTFVETGTPATFIFDHVLIGGSGAILETGTMAGLLYDRTLLVQGGVFIETGSPADLVYVRKLVAGSGTFVETGTAADLVRTRIAEFGSGTFTLTGTPADLLRGFPLIAGSGTFIVTGGVGNLYVESGSSATGEVVTDTVTGQVVANAAIGAVIANAATTTTASSAATVGGPTVDSTRVVPSTVGTAIGVVTPNTASVTIKQ
jgi:hypothetical protein